MKIGDNGYELFTSTWPLKLSVVAENAALSTVLIT